MLGPRQTGKSTLIRSLKPNLEINLAHERTFLDFTSDPEELERRIAATEPTTIFIDEVQRLPSILNTVQVLLDSSRKYRFFLTGSSARKLRRGRANLLPGRIHSFQLGPLVSAECRYALKTDQALETGTLPGIYTEADPAEREKTLRSYAAIYLKEEVQAEALTRNLEGFARFLRVAAAAAGQFLDLSKLASEAQVNRHAAIRFFEILEDTLLVIRSEAFAKSARRRLIQHPRFFFFDNGVLNGVLGNFICSADRRGALFENFVLTQILHSAHAKDRELQISSYRTEHGAEVDFIVEFPDGTCWAIEVKAGRSVHDSDLSGLSSFADFYKKKHVPLIIYGGAVRKRLGRVSVLPVQEALKEMGL